MIVRTCPTQLLSLQVTNYKRWKNDTFGNYAAWWNFIRSYVTLLSNWCKFTASRKPSIGLLREQWSYWQLIILTVLCASTILGSLSFSLWFRLLTMILKCWTQNNFPTPDCTEQILNPTTSSPIQDTDEPKDYDLRGNVTFIAYPLQQANLSNLQSCIELVRLTITRKTLQNCYFSVLVPTPQALSCTIHRRIRLHCLEMLRLIPGNYRVNAVIAIRTQCGDFATVHLCICIKRLIRPTDVLTYAILFFNNHRNVSASHVVRTQNYNYNAIRKKYTIKHNTLMPYNLQIYILSMYL
jgi:hypothetical protein